MKTRIKSKRGISLIVLVITVVVMIILSAAVILLVNESIIVKNANKAVKASDIAKAKEIVMMSKTDWRTNQKNIRKAGFTSFKNYAESMLSEFGFKIGNNAEEFEVSERGLLYEYKTPVVPNGFIASDKDTEDEVSEGFVIYEGNESVLTDEDAMETRNQFVWIPVPNMTEFNLTDGYKNNNIQKHIFLEEVSEPCLESVLSLTKEDFKTGEYLEYESMKASIEKYGGFYIARYETGTTTPRTNNAKDVSFKLDGTTPDVLIQKGKPVYNYVGWGDSMTDIGQTEAVYLSRSMYLNTEVTSHLIYGVEWDAALRFINDNTLDRNSSIYGNYINYNESVDETKKVEGAGSLQNTGTSENWKCKNIYDLAGNAGEWTMEAFHGALIGRTTRGGSASYSGIEQPISNRTPYSTSQTEEMLGFRIALYLK